MSNFDFLIMVLYRIGGRAVNTEFGGFFMYSARGGQPRKKNILILFLCLLLILCLFLVLFLGLIRLRPPAPGTDRKKLHVTIQLLPYPGESIFNGRRFGMKKSM